MDHWPWPIQEPRQSDLDNSPSRTHAAQSHPKAQILLDRRNTAWAKQRSRTIYALGPIPIARGHPSPPQRALLLFRSQGHGTAWATIGPCPARPPLECHRGQRTTGRTTADMEAQHWGPGHADWEGSPRQNGLPGDTAILGMCVGTYRDLGGQPVSTVPEHSIPGGGQGARRGRGPAGCCPGGFVAWQPTAGARVPRRPVVPLSRWDIHGRTGASHWAILSVSVRSSHSQVFFFFLLAKVQLWSDRKTTYPGHHEGWQRQRDKGPGSRNIWDRRHLE